VRINAPKIPQERVHQEGAGTFNVALLDEVRRVTGRVVLEVLGARECAPGERVHVVGWTTLRRELPPERRVRVGAQEGLVRGPEIAREVEGMEWKRR
jgi:hypothetical protein